MRTFTPEATTALGADVIRPISMLKLQLDGGNILIHSGVGIISYNGDDYAGVGNYGTISEVGEVFDSAPAGITATLTGIPSEYISLVVGEHYQGRTAEVYFALLNESHEIIADPILAFRGRIDYADVQLGNTADISLTIESRLIDWNRPRVRRYTNEDQQQEYPNDRGLEFVAQMVEKEIIWGSY